MNPLTARDPLSQRILDLTLEMIFLLTGEGHMVVKIHEMVSDSSRHQISEGHGRSQSFNTEPPPHSGIHEQNHEKILELSNQIIRLLTGEVPIRCEDVTVYLSMEEWEYVERHKELYEDLMMEDHRPLRSLGSSTQESGSSQKGTLKYTDVYSPVEHKPSKCPSTPNNDEEEGHLLDIYPPDQRIQKESPGTRNKENLASLEGHLKDTCPAAEHTQTECPSTLKENPASCEGYLKDLPTDHKLVECPSPHFKGKLTPRKGRNLVDIYPHVEQADYMHINIKEEAVSGEEGLAGLYPPTEKAQAEYIPTHIKEEPTSWEEDLTEIYKPRGHTHGDCVSTANNESLSYEGRHFTTTYFYTPEELFKHQRDPSNQKHACPECGKQLSSKSKLTTHRRTHTLDKPFSCPDCKKCFKYKSNLGKHAKTHTGKKTCVCSECGKGFIHNSVLVRHKLIHKGEKPFACSQCARCFIYKSDLVRHQKIHTGEKPFACSECGKCFTQKTELVSHQRLHTVENPYCCSECGKCFINNSQLLIHRRTHTGEKPYSCLECGKRFTRKKVLLAHQKFHEESKPHLCSECGKCFTLESDLVLHQRTHSGQEPYFGEKHWPPSMFQLVSHHRPHTEKDVYPCPEYDKYFI